MENNSVTRSSTNTSTSPTMTDTPSKEQGIAVVTAFMFESGLIVMGNVLTLIIFAREKKLRKKSLFLVMNMALADVMLGTVSLPLFVFFYRRTQVSAVDCKEKCHIFLFFLFS